jgi:hypothetical protein
VKAITRRSPSTESLPALTDDPPSRLVTSLLEVISHQSEGSVYYYLFCTQDPKLLVRVADPDPSCIQIQKGQWIRIRNLDPDPRGQK